MKIVREFKQFALRGNVVDLAVGVIVGSAFSRIVSSLVEDIVTPVLSLITGTIQLSDRVATLRNGPAPITLKYGSFVQNVIDFVLVALVIFFMVKAINRLHRREPERAQPKEPSPEENLLAEIRDILRSRT